MTANSYPLPPAAREGLAAGASGPTTPLINACTDFAEDFAEDAKIESRTEEQPCRALVVIGKISRDVDQRAELVAAVQNLPSPEVRSYSKLDSQHGLKEPT